MKKLNSLLILMVISFCPWQTAWADDVSVTVSLGDGSDASLGTEVLHYMETTLHIADPSVTQVTSLTVTGGTMNAADWTLLQSFSSLTTLDLERASSESVPDNQFQNNTDNLVTVKLPSNLKTIGEGAFLEQLNLTSITIPSGVTSIGRYAFYQCRKLQTIGGWPSGAKTIPYECFYNCRMLEPFDIPNTVEIIETQAFDDCFLFSSDMPTSLKKIGHGAFSRCAMTDIDIVFPEGIIIDGGYLFDDSGIRSIIFPTTFYTVPTSNAVVGNCDRLIDITFKSPTVVEHSSYFGNANRANITLHVPSYLVNSYKLDANWMLFKKVEGFETNTISDWTVQSVLNLSGSSRIEGDANMDLTETATLKISGSTAQAFGNFSTTVSTKNNNTYPQNWKYSLILSTCPNVSVTGDYTHRFLSDKGRWYFLCLPFDFAVNNIETENDVKFAIRYYDGAHRASTGAASGNWTDYATNAVVPAGTGFIIQTSDKTWITFKAQANASRNNVFKTEEITTTLAANNSANAVHKGWNLVGNPWQCYYNIHKLNYTAPISAYNMSYNKYDAYSKADDDYAILPNQAFFVQCPDEVSSIGFPIDGRQLTSVITDQAGARMRRSSLNRRLFELQIEGNGGKDKTRLVVNEAAKMDYELTCDASKIIAEGSSTPQIYSLDTDGTEYAINERPMDDGTLKIGIIFPADGEYTLSAIRNEIGKVVLKDLETGTETDLQQSDYKFTVSAGETGTRFSISFGGNTTGIKTLRNADDTTVEVYTLDGRMVGNSTTGLKKGVYMVRKGNQTEKVMVQ